MPKETNFRKNLQKFIDKKLNSTTALLLAENLVKMKYKLNTS